jgi:hypothetical protein
METTNVVGQESLEFSQSIDRKHFDASDWILVSERW